jgi:hypothetical protein
LGIIRHSRYPWRHPGEPPVFCSPECPAPGWCPAGSAQGRFRDQE